MAAARSRELQPGHQVGPLAGVQVDVDEASHLAERAHAMVAVDDTGHRVCFILAEVCGLSRSY